MLYKKHTASLIGVAVLSALSLNSIPLSAQVLEEVIVSAQRRDQSIQEVPISLESISGVEMQRQGFRQMEDLSNFSPSVEINESLHEWSVTIRGMGNDVANMSIEQSAPMFVDGVAFGRPSMIKGAFLDLERVEVLRGPQPIYFGQNATAGAFSLVTRKPTPEWEGEVTTEVGNFGRLSFEGGIGGPVTDTLGVRVAGKWDRTTGHIRDLYDGQMFPNRKDIAGRVTIAWNPTDNFEAMFKAEYTERKSQGDTNISCLGKGDIQDILLNGERAVLIPGLVPGYDALHTQTPVPDCSDGSKFQRYGVREDFGPLKTLVGIKNVDGRTGSVDIYDFGVRMVPNGVKAREPLEAWNYRLGLAYTFANDYMIESTSGMVDYGRETFESTDESPIAMEAAYRVEEYDMWSQEFRIVSPSGGPIEWSAGAYYQTEELDLNPAYTLRANIRTPLRVNYPWQDSDWYSAFATFTFNFLDDKASIDVGGRYSNVKKHAAIRAEGAAWIFDINPFTNGINAPSTHHVTGAVRNLRLANPAVPSNAAGNNVIIDCGNPFIPTIVPTGTTTTVTASGNPCGSYGAGFWTHQWNARDVPDAWNAQAPVDIGPLLAGYTDRPGPFNDRYSEDSFDPQVTLRYRPTPDLSLYGKWARAFKAGGFDSSDRGIPNGGIGTDIGQDDFSFLAEHAENFELGAKGNLFDGRAMYNVTLFQQTIRDLQIETEIIDLANFVAGQGTTGRGQTNAGKQRTQGVEFDLTYAASEYTTMVLAGVVQKGRMLDFIGGCTEAEFAAADSNDCISAAESIALIGSDELAGFIDRAGSQAPRTPKWKFIGGLDTWHPLFGNYKGTFNTKVAYSAGYTEDTLGFSREVSWPKHIDWNITLGFGDQDDVWMISGFVRNILGARQRYFPEEDIDPIVFLEEDLSQTAFTTYGLQFKYNFR